MKTDVHQNSIAAFHEEEGRFGARAGAILAWIHVHGEATDREVMLGLGFTDPNSVRPRISELIDSGDLEEVRSTRCPHSRKTVRVVDVPRPGQRALFS